MNISELSDIQILELLGRKQNLQDLSDINLHNAVILVTGAAGSIGSRLCKVLMENFNLKNLICVDFAETPMFNLQEDLQKYENVVYKIADVKNRDRMENIIETYSPNIIFYCAAYKHVPLMEDNPTEAFQNNIGGILTLTRIVIEHQIENFVFISTDKAVNPESVMGATKRLSELIIQKIAKTNQNTKFTIIRFGNVIQSNGSVINTFKKQAQRGLKLTVTSKEVFRYFMTIEEAVYLIIKSMEIGKSGDILLLNMGEPINIYDLAEKLDSLRDEPKGIELIGLRKGEKLKEELSFNEKTMQKTENDKVFVIKDRLFEELSVREFALELLDETDEIKLIQKLIDYGLLIRC